MTDHDLLGGLLAEGFEPGESLFGPNDKLDELLDPGDIIQVVDADASQTKVIEEVKKGANLVVQGPPGTGKSQTITNIIAAAVHDGKSVLFVAEKMAALNVVHQRLVKSGLRDVCLELHSRSANKKALAQELGRTLMASAQAVPAVTSVDSLRQSRDRLNQIEKTLHEPMAGGRDTPFRAMSEIIGLIGRGVSAPAIPLNGLEKIGPDERQAARQVIERFTQAMAEMGPPEQHPFCGTDAHDLQPTDRDRLESELSQAIAAIGVLQAQAAALAGKVQRPVPESLRDVSALAEIVASLGGAPENIAAQISQPMLDRAEDSRLAEGLAAGRSWAEARLAAEGIFAASAWGANLAATLGGIAAGRGSFFTRILGPYRKASAELVGHLSVALPKSPEQRLALVDQLFHVQELRKRLAEDEDWLQPVLGDHWRGERTSFSMIEPIVGWLAAVKRNGLNRIEDILPVLNAFDLPPGRPSFITRVLGFDSGRFRVWQARRARSLQIAQAPGALLLGSCFPARNAA